LAFGLALFETKCAVLCCAFFSIYPILIIITEHNTLYCMHIVFFNIFMELLDSSVVV
jgi:hypothetical protein